MFFAADNRNMLVEMVGLPFICHFAFIGFQRHPSVYQFAIIERDLGRNREFLTIPFELSAFHSSCLR